MTQAMARNWRDSSVVMEIEAALAQVEAGALDIEVHLCWPDYQGLLGLKGLDTDARQIRAWGSGYERRPLKIYRKHVLKYTQYSSLIIYSRRNGSIGSVQIKWRGDDEGRFAERD